MKKNHFSNRMVDKTDLELESIVSNDQSYVEEARQAAIWELERRNLKSDIVVKAEEEIQSMQIKREERRKEKVEFFKKDPNIADDPNLPELYSKRAIAMFSVFFTIIFGAVLLMHNMKKTENEKLRIAVLVFGIVYTGMMIVIMNSIKTMHNLALVFNSAGAIILTELFWNKQIGKGFKYRKKGILKPLIISILITIPFLLAIFYGE